MNGRQRRPRNGHLRRFAFDDALAPGAGNAARDRRSVARDLGRVAREATGSPRRAGEARRSRRRSRQIRRIHCPWAAARHPRRSPERPRRRGPRSKSSRSELVAPTSFTPRRRQESARRARCRGGGKGRSGCPGASGALQWDRSATCLPSRSKATSLRLVLPTSKTATQSVMRGLPLAREPIQARRAAWEGRRPEPRAIG